MSPETAGQNVQKQNEDEVAVPFAPEKETELYESPFPHWFTHTIMACSHLAWVTVQVHT